jgi:hypothetical protein
LLLAAAGVEAMVTVAVAVQVALEQVHLLQ